MDRLKRRFHARRLRRSGCAFCMSGVFVSKEEATHSGDPLTGAVHVVGRVVREGGCTLGVPWWATLSLVRGFEEPQCRQRSDYLR